MVFEEVVYSLVIEVDNHCLVDVFLKLFYYYS
jgi:hypothetical protein